MEKTLDVWEVEGGSDGENIGRVTTLHIDKLLTIQRTAAKLAMWQFYRNVSSPLPPSLLPLPPSTLIPAVITKSYAKRYLKYHLPRNITCQESQEISLAKASDFSHTNAA